MISSKDLWCVSLVYVDETNRHSTFCFWLWWTKGHVFGLSGPFSCISKVISVHKSKLMIPCAGPRVVWVVVWLFLRIATRNCSLIMWCDLIFHTKLEPWDPVPTVWSWIFAIFLVLLVSRTCALALYCVSRAIQFIHFHVFVFAGLFGGSPGRFHAKI